MTFIREKTLKYDAFGSIEKGFFIGTNQEALPAIQRIYTKNIIIKPIAKMLALQEIRALRHLEQLQVFSQLPRILMASNAFHVRSYIEGVPLYSAIDVNFSAYFLECQKLLRRMRKVGICNNDLAKEANWLVTPTGLPALMDFQLALIFRNKGNKLFLSFCYDDLRHCLKCKRKYNQVSSRGKKILRRKSLVSRLWRQTGKKIYLFVTRKILRWEERIGPEERNI